MRRRRGVIARRRSLEVLVETRKVAKGLGCRKGRQEKTVIIKEEEQIEWRRQLR